MKKIILLLVVITAISCNKREEVKATPVQQKNSELTSVQMDLGAALYASKIVEFDCDTEKADSAYAADKYKIVKDIYEKIK